MVFEVAVQRFRPATEPNVGQARVRIQATPLCSDRAVPSPRSSAMPVQPYLFFDGRCEEALDFYTRVLGAQVLEQMKFRDSPEKPPPGMLPPGSEDKIMHASFRVAGTTIMASDGMCGGQPEFRGFSLSIRVNGDDEADRLFNGLAEGGSIRMPLGRTFYARRFGMVADRFGVSWMILTGETA
jgi:PhnB protein